MRHYLFGCLATAVMGHASVAMASDDVVTEPEATQAPEEQPSGEQYELTGEVMREFRTAEESVVQAKENAHRARATIQLLKELTLQSTNVGSRVNLWQINRLGNGFRLESATYTINGATIFSKIDPGGELGTLEEMELPGRTLAPGRHTLEVSLKIRGSGSGVFTYMDAYSFSAVRRCEFNVVENHITTVQVEVSSKASLKRYADRIQLLCRERRDDMSADQ